MIRWVTTPFLARNADKDVLCEDIGFFWGCAQFLN